MENQKVKKVEYNWFYTTENGSEYGVAEVGKAGVIEIWYNTPQGEGDRHSCDIILSNDSRERVFNLNRIFSM